MKNIIVVLLILVSTVSVYGKNKYEMSVNGHNLIKSYEKCSLTRYKDSHGYSIGWGHLIKKGESYKRISQNQADKLFVQDIQWVNAAINRLLKPINNVQFSQNFIDGLGDLVYNCGEEGVKKTTFYKRLLKCRVKNGKIIQNDFNFTVAAVKTAHVYEPGHKIRRYNCHKLMIK